jgi:hypothetical protein
MTAKYQTTDEALQNIERLFTQNSISGGFVTVLPTTHVSAQTNRLASYVVTVPSKTRAQIILPRHFEIGGQSLYVVPITSRTDQEAYIVRAKVAIEELAKDDRFYDDSVRRVGLMNTETTSDSSVFLRGMAASVGLYQFTRRINSLETELVLAFLIRSVSSDSALDKLVAVKSLNEIVVNALYKKTIEQGDVERAQLASYLHTKSGGAGVLLPTVTNRFNVIGTNHTTELFTYYSDCFSPDHVENGVIVGEGRPNGYTWFSGIKFELKRSSRTKIVSIPLGTLRVKSLTEAKTTRCSGSILTWGTVGPNPYSDPKLYAGVRDETGETDRKRTYLEAFVAQGVDLTTTDIIKLVPKAVYSASSCFLSSDTHPLAMHTSLADWLAYPGSDPEVVAIPVDHPWIINRFMYLMSKRGQRDLITDVLKGQTNKMRFYFFVRKPLEALLSMDL